jgi:hypothetical protein
MGYSKEILKETKYLNAPKKVKKIQQSSALQQ